MSGALVIQTIESAALSDVGRVRSENQDACAELHNAAGARLLLVADGMGGHRGGSIASQLAVEAFGEVFQRAESSGGALLEAALDAANERVHTTAADDPGLHGMGTTVVALLLEASGDTAWIAHVGDSRLYRLRSGKLQQITQDHSAVAELVRRGAITPEEAATHPRRNEILRSLGVESEVDPDIAPLDLQPGDQVLLCSDGLSGVLTDAEIEAVLLRSPPGQAVKILVDTVNSRGAPDNVTVMIAAVPGSLPIREPLAAIESAPSSAPAANLRRIAAATGAVVIALALLLLLALLRAEWPFDDLAPDRTARSPRDDLALTPVPEAGAPDVAAPEEPAAKRDTGIEELEPIR